MSGYEYFAKVCESKGLKASDVSRATGIRSGVFSDWKAGRYTPKADKMKLIADFLGIPVESLLTGVQTDEHPGYYIDSETADIAQEIFDTPELRILFDAARNSRPEDLQMAADLLRRLKKTNPDG